MNSKDTISRNSRYGVDLVTFLEQNKEELKKSQGIYVVQPMLVRNQDLKSFKIGKAVNLYNRLRAYCVSYGKIDKKYPCAGVKLYFLHKIPKSYRIIKGVRKPLLNIVENSIQQVYRKKGFKTKFGKEYYTRINLREFGKEFNKIYKSSKLLKDIATRKSKRIENNKKLKRALKKLS